MSSSSSASPSGSGMFSGSGEGLGELSGGSGVGVDTASASSGGAVGSWVGLPPLIWAYSLRLMELLLNSLLRLPAMTTMAANTTTIFTIFSLSIKDSFLWVLWAFPVSLE